MIDPAAGQVVDTISVGKRPRGIRLSRDGKQLLVALSGSAIAGPGVDESKLPPPDRSADGIGVVDLATHKLVRKYESGDDPEVFDLSPDGSTIYVSNEDAAQASVVDVASGNIAARISVGGEPEGVTVNPDGTMVFVTSEENGDVAAIDTKTRKVLARIKTGPRPRSVTFSKDGAIAFVPSETAGLISIIDVPKRKVTSTIKLPAIEGAPTPPRPMGGVLSPDGKQLFMSLGRAGSVAVIDVASRKLLRTIDGIGARPWGVDPQRGRHETLHGQRAERRRLHRRCRKRQGREEGFYRRQPVGHRAETLRIGELVNL